MRLNNNLKKLPHRASIEITRSDKVRRRYLLMKSARDNDGVSNIVTSIMMLGIFLSILAMIFTVYIPNWAKSGESNHMGRVLDSYLDLKSNIDNQIGDEKGIGDSRSTRIKLGAEGGSVLGIGRTTGSISFKTSEFYIQVYNTEEPQNIYGQASGKIIFESGNTYFADQDFTYENGAVIVEQSRSSILRAKPNFDVSHTDNKTSVVCTLIHMSGAPAGESGTGYYTVDSELIQSTAQSHILIWSSEMGFEYGQNITINISTKFGPVWQDFIETELDELPSDIKQNNTQVNVTKRKIPTTGVIMYDIHISITEVYKLDCKQGIVEIDIT
jgi:hypothetical protein